jgi:DNA-binding transcriptional LysR family regulator
MNPALLRTFLSVRRHLNYTRAAEELFLTQPAVSRQIRQLEAELGLRLFEQIGKTLHLTEGGKTLAVEAVELLGHIERATETVQAHAALDRGRISLGASSTPGLYLLPEVVGRFRRQFPNVEVHYTVENSRRIEQKVLSNDVDLGFVGVAPSSAAVNAETWLADRIVFFAAVDDPLGLGGQLDARRLAEHTWVIREQGAATRTLVERRLSRQRIKPKHVIEMSCPEGVKALVAAGVGISYMSIHGLADDLAQKRFRLLDVRGFDLRRSIYAIQHKDKHVSAPMKEFRKLLAPVTTATSRGDAVIPARR